MVGFSEGKSFIFGDGTPWSYEQLQRQRKIANNLRAANARTPQNVGEGIAAVGRALGARRRERRADEREGVLRDEFNQQISALLGGGQPQFSPPQFSSPPPVSSGPIPEPDLGNDAMAALGRPQNGQPAQWREAIAGIESAGSGDYSALGPVTNSGDRAYGRYQVMGNNVGPWTREVFGREMTPQEFLASPQAQDAVFDAKFGQSVARYGNPQDAASVWFTGRPQSQGANASDILGTTGSQYVERFNSGLGQSSPQTQPQGGQDIGQIMALMSNPMATPAQKAYLGQLLQQQMPQPAASPLEQAQLERLQLQNEALRNPVPEPGFVQLTPEEAKSNGLDTSKAWQRGPDGKIYQIGGSGQNINITNTPAGAVPEIPAYPTLDKGFAYVRDQNGQVIINEQGVPSVAPITGGPADIKADEAAAAAALAEDQAKGKDALAQRSGAVVLEDIGRLRSLVKNAPWYSPATGFGAGAASGIAGSNAADAKALANTIRGNIGFDRLQQMREASKTGGALGAINKTELDTLQAVLGSLENSQSEEQFLYNLDRLERIYTGILNKASAYDNAAEFGFAGGITSGDAPDSPDIPQSALDDGFTADDWQYMTPEEKADYQ